MLDSSVENELGRRLGKEWENGGDRNVKNGKERRGKQKYDLIE
jgi:hypothetical protein